MDPGSVLFSLSQPLVRILCYTNSVNTYVSNRILGQCNLYDDGLDTGIVWERQEINKETVRKNFFKSSHLEEHDGRITLRQSYGDGL
jgi:hypothetical protein